MSPNHYFCNSIPMIPMVVILQQFAAAHHLEFDRKRFASIREVFNLYITKASLLN